MWNNICYNLYIEMKKRARLSLLWLLGDGRRVSRKGAKIEVIE